MDGFHTHALKTMTKIRVFSQIAAAETTSFTFSMELFDSQISCAIRSTIWPCVCKQHLNVRPVTYSETQQKTGLPHTRVSDQQELEQVITETQTRGPSMPPSPLLQSAVSCVTWKWELHYATCVCVIMSQWSRDRHEIMGVNGGTSHLRLILYTQINKKYILHDT